jgi:hypothetical protein
MQQCLFCGHIVTLVHVHGHYQCPVCTTNALPCCDGDNCHTNLLLKDEIKAGYKLPVVQVAEVSNATKTNGSAQSC